jgi:hypothetical protein
MCCIKIIVIEMVKLQNFNSEDLKNVVKIEENFHSFAAHVVFTYIFSKGKAIPLQALTGP